MSYTQVNIFSKCFRSNAEEINLLLSFFKKQKKIVILIFFYLMANNQLKCRIFYEKITMLAGDVNE